MDPESRNYYHMWYREQARTHLDPRDRCPEPTGLPRRATPSRAPRARGQRGSWRDGDSSGWGSAHERAELRVSRHVRAQVSSGKDGSSTGSIRRLDQRVVRLYRIETH